MEIVEKLDNTYFKKIIEIKKLLDMEPMGSAQIITLEPSCINPARLIGWEPLYTTGYSLCSKIL